MINKQETKSELFIFDKCQMLYNYFAINNEDKLLFILTTDNLEGINLILAIEAAGNVLNRRKSVPILVKFLYHHLPAVRESAISSLSRKITPKIKNEFYFAAKMETNETLLLLLESKMKKLKTI